MIEPNRAASSPRTCAVRTAPRLPPRPGGALAGCSLLALLGLVAASGPLAAQLTARPSAQPADTFADRLRVLEVEVPVQVLRRGEPVRGLAAEDFRVRDRGELREIVGFEVYDLSLERSEDSAAAATSVPAAPASRSFLVILDFANNQGGYIARGIAALRTMVLDQMHPADRMALVGIGTRGSASIVTGFTGDRERLSIALDYLDALADRRVRRQREAIAALTASSPSSAGEQAQAYGRAAVEAFGDGLASVLLTAGPGIDTGMAGEVGSQLGAGSARGVSSGIEDAFAIGTSLVNYQRYRDTSLYAEALGNLGSLLSGVTGQKHALLLSQGPPFDTFVTRTGGATEPPSDGSHGVAKAIERMTEQLSRSGWRIHTLGQGLGFNPSLFYLANETGGVAFENYNRLEVATADLIEQTSVTYLLRILASDVVADGRRHDLAVELVDPRDGAEVRHRPNYYAPRPDAELSDVERRIAEAERRFERSARVLRAGVLAVPIAEGPDRNRVLVGISIGAAEIRELSGRGVVAIEVFVTEGARQPADSLLYRVELDRQTLDRLPAGGVTFLGDLRLPVDAARLDVQVRAEDRRLSRSIAIGDADATRALAPLFFVSSGERLLLREAEQGATFEWPLRVGAEEVVPWVEPAVERGEQLGAMLWLLGSLPSRLPAPVFLITGEGGLRADADRAVTVREAQLVEGRDAGPEDRRAAQLAIVDTRELLPGEYRLEVLWPGLEHPPLLGSFRVLPEE
jgi:VWFA-related protein